MKKNFNNFIRAFAIAFTLLFFTAGVVGAYSANAKSGQVVEKDKLWNINFNKEIKFDDIAKNEIKVIDSKKNRVNVELSLGKDNKSIIVNPPNGGYKVGESYTLVLGKDISSKENKRLNKEITMEFTIKDYDKENIMDKLIVLPNESYDVNEANRMISRLNKIPSPILQKLAENKVKIILSNTNITEVKEYEYLKGVTPRGWEGTGKTWDDVPGAGGKPVVARIGYSDPGEAHGAVNLELHETAHAIDKYVFNDVSSSESYKTMWKQEVKNVFGDNPYFVNYPEEYFAETFAMYYVNEEQNLKLKEKAPLTYEFIKNLENTINGVVSVKADYFFILCNQCYLIKEALML